MLTVSFVCNVAVYPSFLFASSNARSESMFGHALAFTFAFQLRLLLQQHSLHWYIQKSADILYTRKRAVVTRVGFIVICKFMTQELYFFQPCDQSGLTFIKRKSIKCLQRKRGEGGGEGRVWFHVLFKKESNTFVTEEEEKAICFICPHCLSAFTLC